MSETFQEQYDREAMETVDNVILLSELADKPVADKTESAYPVELLKPIGMLREIAVHIDDTAARRMPVYSLAGAISLISLASANKYRVGPWNTCLNVYSTLVGLTGSGKAHPHNKVKELSELAGFGGHVIESFSSDAGIFRWLKDNRFGLLAQDEIGHLLSLSQDKGAHWEKTIVKALLQLYGLSNSRFSGKGYAKSEDNVDGIDKPYLSVLGATTPAKFMAAIETAYVHDGLLNRFLVFRSDELPSMQVPSSEKPKASMIKRLHDINALAISTDTPHTIPVDARAQGELIAVSQMFDHKNRTDPEFGAMWSRGFENTVKLAGICALGCFDDPREAEVDSTMVMWAEGVVTHSFGEMVHRLETEQYETEFDKDCQKVLGYIREANQYYACNQWGQFCGKGLMPRSKLLKLVKKSSKYLDTVVEYLDETDTAREKEAIGKNGSKVVVYVPV